MDGDRLYRFRAILAPAVICTALIHASSSVYAQEGLRGTLDVAPATDPSGGPEPTTQPSAIDLPGGTLFEDGDSSSGAAAPVVANTGNSRTPTADADRPNLRGALAPLVVAEDADVETRSPAADRQDRNRRTQIASDVADPPPPRRLRPVVLDGDAIDQEQPVILDGTEPIGEPPAQHDAIDTTSTDMRDPEDIAAFEDPPAGFDPLLFQIEDIDPLSDRRPRRFFTAEPYDPIGVKLGSFVWFPEAELSGASFSNIFEAPRAVSDEALGLATRHRLVSNWSVHALEFEAAINRDFNNEFQTEEEDQHLLRARGRLDVTRRTNAQVSASRAVEQESRSAIDAPQAGERTRTTVEELAGTLQHRFNRLRLQLRGALTDNEFGSVAVATAARPINDRNYHENSGALRASWEFKPTLNVFSEIELVSRDFETAATSDGLFRDSDGQRFRTGISFGNTGAFLRGEVALGYGRQDHKDRRLGEFDAFLVDANLAWRMSALTTLLATATTDLTDSTDAGARGVSEHQVSLEVRHAIRRHLIVMAGFAIDHRQFEGLDAAENELTFSLGSEYFINRNAILFGRYEHSRFRSDFPASDFDADEVRVGVRVRR